ncbi:hypothetical protein P170DRAFT_365976 [Aspergillus steynii IBT 23096]|uniref:RRM domain-containing protein n=1 Tax=Aspergillus steynii IBT 23096 TaxID=1392250 RepID=A0A2I2FWZ6_9EURO|nr:uncharacterized protein P170DRAFT_365976 [Aspergillus steynii IBT 23096]PLB45160.1 hypothetical protein P170DRAFT_365976 [Aspergillus steynii IBT 23096]
MPAPQKARMTKSRGSDEEFVLFLQGIPAHCRWQELKDMVRQTALHIRQAVVYDDNHGFPTGLGQIIVKNEDEAWRTYHRLSTNGWEGQSLVVTLARTSSPTRPIAGPTKSPTCVIPPNYVAGYSTPPRVTQNLAVPPSPMTPEPVNSNSPTYQTPDYGAPMMSPMGMPQPFMPIFADPLTHTMPGFPPSPVLRASYCDPNFAFAFLPPYALPPMPHPLHEASLNAMRMNSGTASNNRPTKPIHGLPIQHRHSLNPNSPIWPASCRAPGPGPTGRPFSRRTIFIQNLSVTTTKKDLENFLQGPNNTGIEQSEIPTDAETGRCKGFARVTFHHADEAKRAVARYNNAIFMGAKIRVKIDRSIHVAYSSSQGPPRAAPGPDDAANTASTGTPSSPTAPEGPAEENKVSPVLPAGTSPGAGGRRESLPKIDRCQPLVVNGSGIGRRAVTA